MISTCLIGALLYNYTSDLLKDEIVSANNELLLQTSKIVDQSLNEVQQIATTISLSPDVLKSVWMPWNLDEEYRFLKATADLFDNRLASSNYIHSIFLYSSNNQKLVSNFGITELSDFSNKQLLEQFIQSKSTVAWEAGKIASRDGGSENILTLLVSVPLRNQKKIGTLLINLKEDVLYNAVVNTNNRKLGNVAILNKDGDVLSYKDKSLLLTPFVRADIAKIKEQKEGYFVQEISGQKMFVSFLKSPFNNWIYITTNSYNELFQRSYEVIIMTLIISGIGLVVGLLLIIIISRRHYRPVRDMVQALTAQMENPFPQKNQDEFSFISASIDRMQLENETFKSKFQGQEIVLRDHLLLNLLSGKLIDDQETLNQLTYFNLDLDTDNFLVMSMRVHFVELILPPIDEKLRHLIYFRIRTICEEVVGSDSKIAYVSGFHKHDVLILNTKNWDTSTPVIASAKQLAFQIKHKLAEELDHVAVTFGIGGHYKHLTDIHLSYNESMEVLLLERIAGVGSILSIYDLDVNHTNRSLFIICQQQVDKLIGELKSGHTDKAVGTKNQMLNQVQHDNQFGIYFKNVILFHLLNALVTVRMELAASTEEEQDEKENNWHHEFAKLQNFEQISALFDRLMMDIARNMESRRHYKNSEVMMKLAQYVREHYREPLSLQMISDMVFMNSHYVSKLFKNTTGTTFIDFLTDIRYREASRLLKETDHTMNDIAEMTGFGNKQNLNRTFKKMTGLTPTEYRSQEVQKRLDLLNTNK
ncbi:AraC family transcriptional regulator [Paenibacillus nasutitermitis]|uniref:AraC family transcriptional regulator n=1 Tax=Paenibacillus nasutitermitis TaxID=1652958 RepID=A0A917DVF5_9BACL|nr:AraC family transcriptional regulator [Paenibacillus nasutitermitis]